MPTVFTLLVQDAMRAAGRSGTEDCPVQMKLVAPPLYVLTTQTLDKNKGIQVLNDAIEVAEQTIKSHKGNFKVKEAPRTVSERDDLLLQSKVCIFVCTLALHLKRAAQLVHLPAVKPCGVLCSPH